MKRKIISSFFAILFIIGIVSAGIGIDAMSKSTDMDKVERDMLLSKTDEGKIEPAIDIKCTDEYCLWSAFQSGIINSRDNKMSRSYCSETNEKSEDCIKTTYYDDDEIQVIIADAVTSRLSNYAQVEISRADAPTDWGTGIVTVEEKK